MHMCQEGALTTLYVGSNNINQNGEKQLQDAVQGRDFNLHI